MGKKCVQAVESVRTKMCTSRVYTQRALLDLVSLCTKSVLPLASPAAVHIMYSLVPICNNTQLYPVSTEPTITTTCLEKLKTLKTLLGELV